MTGCPCFSIVWSGDFGAPWGRIRKKWEDLFMLQRIWTDWWFGTCFIFRKSLGWWSNLTNIFQGGWNHQPVMACPIFRIFGKSDASLIRGMRQKPCTTWMELCFCPGVYNYCCLCQGELWIWSMHPYWILMLFTYLFTSKTMRFPISQTWMLRTKQETSFELA